MNECLRRCLDDLEARIDDEAEERLFDQWRDFTYGRFEGEVFCPRRKRPAAPSVDWPSIKINDGIDDFDSMALHQYRICSDVLGAGGGQPMAVRANYGTSILPLLFGVEPFVMPEETDTLPTSWPLRDSDAVARLVEAGLPSLTGGYGEKVFEMGRRFRDLAREYPKIGRHVHTYHPDLQGPLDVSEVIWGSEIFYAFYDEPDLVKALLELVTDTYIAFMREWEKIEPFADGANAHWDLVHGGSIMLRNDSSMNISQGFFEEFSRPYDRRILGEFGGGAVHFCGRGDHYIESLSEMDGLYAINLSQPQLNDMETVFRHTVDKGLNLLELTPAATAAAVESGRELHGLVHCDDFRGS